MKTGLLQDRFLSINRISDVISVHSRCIRNVFQDHEKIIIIQVIYFFVKKRYVIL